MDARMYDTLEQLIQAVTSEPMLYQPDFTKQFKLEVDASLFAIGAVLFQKDEKGQWRPISYFSQALNPTERNYDIWDYEFLAMIRGLKHNRHLLVGSPHKVVILMDHENLVHYRHPQKINRQVARYLHTLPISTWSCNIFPVPQIRWTPYLNYQTMMMDRKTMRKWSPFLTHYSQGPFELERKKSEFRNNNRQIKACLTNGRKPTNAKKRMAFSSEKEP